jgi:hypothetical protein
MLRPSLLGTLGVLAALAATAARADTLNTFEEFFPGTNAAKPYFTASKTVSGDVPLLSHGNAFNNSYTYNNPDPTWGYTWYGWAVSSRTDKAATGVEGQFTSITGGGSGGSRTYAVAFTYGTPAYGNPVGSADALTSRFHPSDSTITLAPGTTPVSIDITNTAYAFHEFRGGDPYGFQAPFHAGDFQTLDIRGYDASGALLGTVNVSLADYTTATPTILATWKTVDLTPLAGAVELRFGITSSRNDDTYGVSMPTYFAADDFVTRVASVPEPASLALLAAGLALASASARRRAVAASLQEGVAR